LKPRIGLAKVVQQAGARDRIGQIRRQAAARGMEAGERFHAGEVSPEQNRPAVAMRDA